MDKISATFPQVKINLNIQNLTFDALEEMVFDVTRQMGRKVLEKALEDMDQKLKEERPKGTLENTGKRAKYLMTRLGDIRYERTRYRDKQTRKSRYLLEETLGLKPNQRISLSRSKMEMFIASLDTYRGAQENIRLLLGITRSHESIRQFILKEAEQIISHQTSQLEKTRHLEDDPQKPLSDIAYLETDSAFVRFQRHQKRKKGQKTRGKRKSIEIKLGIGYTGKESRYLGGARLAMALQNKFFHVDVVSGTKFMEHLSLIAEKRLGLSQVRAVIVGGDGASWIKKGIEDNFCRAVYVLCRFHLWRNTKRALACRPQDQKTIKHLIQADQIDPALTLIREMIQKPKDPKEKRDLKALYAYIHQNREGINSLDRIQDKEMKTRIRGCGAIESNVDKFIAHRMKKKGMSWSMKGALGLLKVKEKIMNHEWDSWWGRDRDQKIEVRSHAWPELTSQDFWKKETGVTSLLEAEIPALQGSDRNKPWAKVLKELSSVRF